MLNQAAGTLADIAGPALACRLVVAGADTDPAGQTICATEDIHVRADFDQQHGGADQIDSGNGLQQGQRVSLGFKLTEQSGVEEGNAGFDFLDMPHQFVKREAMAGNQVTLRCIEQFLPARLQTVTCEV